MRSQTFQSRIVDFIFRIGMTEERQVEELVTGIVRYVLDLCPYKEVKRLAKRYDVHEQFVDFKQRHLRNSFLCLAALWRAMFFFSRKKKLPPFKKFGVRKSDILFMLDHLSKKDLAALRKRALEQKLTLPKYSKLCKVVLKAVEPIIRRKVKQKLSFIFKSERWIQEEDFVSELRAVAVKNILKYSDRNDIEFIKKAVVQKINHEIVDILSRHTSQKRQYLIRTSEAVYRRSLVKVVDVSGSIKYRVVKQKEKQDVYSSPITYLDDPLSNSEAEEHSSFHDLVECDKGSRFVQESESNNTIQTIIRQTTCTRLQEFVRIVTSNRWPNTFESFLRNNGISNQECSSVKRVADYTKRFLGLTQAEIVNGLTPQLSALGVR